VFLLDRSAVWPSWRQLGTALALTATVGIFNPAMARDRAPQESPPTPTVALSALPSEAQKTHQLILAGGPFPYSKDGVVFGNRERQLPKNARGYYHEYTVKTPGARNRGAKRIVCGGNPPQNPDVCYYTEDHYTSFQRIVK